MEAFSNTSETAYRDVVCEWWITGDNHCDVEILIAKERAAHRKSIWIPRLDLRTGRFGFECGAHRRIFEILPLDCSDLDRFNDRTTSTMLEAALTLLSRTS